MILFEAKTKCGYTSCKIDARILFGLNLKRNILKQLQKKNISYLIVDNLTIVDRWDSLDNQYLKTFYIECIDVLLSTILGKY